jgi:hypothetical protein
MKVKGLTFEPNRKEEKFSLVKRTGETTGAAHKIVKSDIPKAQEIRNLLSCLMTYMK